MFDFLAPFKMWLSLGLVILVLVIVGLGWFKYNHAVIRADKAESDLTSYKVQQKALSDARALENAEKLIAANEIRDAAIKNSNETLAKFNLANINRNKLLQKVSILNEKINQAENIDARTRSNLNDSLRLSSARYSLATSKESSATSQLSTTDSDLTTLRQACRLTTIDLVEAHKIIEADTISCGREK